MNTLYVKNANINEQRSRNDDNKDLRENVNPKLKIVIVNPSIIEPLTNFCVAITTY